MSSFTEKAFTLSCAGDEVVVWGLCDAASAALMHLCRDARVTGLVLANPWVRSEAGLANVVLKHYYAKRLLEVELWRKLRSGQFVFRTAFRDLAFNLVMG